MQTNTSKSIHAIAEIVGCSEGMVSLVLNGHRNGDTKLGKKIKHTARILKENEEAEQRRRDELAKRLSKEVKDQ